MKKWLVVAVAAMALTGCSSNKLSEQDYYNLVHETDGLSGLENQNIEKLGGNICDVFKEADDPYTATLATLTSEGVEAGPAGALIALSVAQYCPDHLGDVPTP